MSVIDEINKVTSGKCLCGKIHSKIDLVTEICGGALKKIPQYIKKYNKKSAFIYADKNTYEVAGKQVCEILSDAAIPYEKYVFYTKDNATLEPCEFSYGQAIMNYNSDCDIIIGVGSGVINDIAKIIAERTNTMYMCVATAPSMDGYASATSSIFLGGRKLSIKCKCPEIIIGDTDVLKNAPQRMLTAGLGDMLAKYLSICEWRISHIITGEYYCDKVAAVIREALKKCVDNADGLLKRDEIAVTAVLEGLIASGIAMKIAGISRPASGIEHSISHIWDMRGLEFGETLDFHGIQCAVGTLIGARIFEQLKQTVPNKAKAVAFAKEFDFGAYSKQLKSFVGSSADEMIEAEAKDGKYNIEKHSKRIDIIVDNWEEILQIIDDEVPSSNKIEEILDTIGCPKSLSELGHKSEDFPMVFAATKDIRDKYVLSRLCWDLGIVDDIDLNIK